MVTIKMYKNIQKFKRKNYSISRICREMELSRPTVRKYYHMNDEEIISYLQETEKREKLFKPYREEIIELYQANATKTTSPLYISSIYDVLEERHGSLPGNAQTLRNFIRYLQEQELLAPTCEERMYQKLPLSPPGKQMQIDFGHTRIQKGVPIHFFAGVLSHSRFKSVYDQDVPFTTDDAIQAILNAFSTIGGRVAQLVIDQDRLFVYQENYGEIITTQKFRDFLQEQDLSLYVCKKADPESKGKVENVVGYIKSSFFSARILYTLEQVTVGLASWLTRTGNGKICQATGRIPAQMLTDEQPFLRPIKPSIYSNEQIINREIRSVNSFGCIHWSGNQYSAPHVYRGKHVEVSANPQRLRIYDRHTHQRIAEHAICPLKGKSITLRSHQRIQTNQIETLYAQLLQEFPYCTVWKQFLAENTKAYSRYRREQWTLLLDYLHANRPTELFLTQAVIQCLKVQAYGATQLRDTIDYVSQKINKTQKKLIAPKPLKTMGIHPTLTVAVRSTQFYQNHLEQSAGGTP